MKKLTLAALAVAVSLTLFGCAPTDTPAAVKETADAPVTDEESAAVDDAPSLGHLAKVGDWDVTVVSVDLDADAVIETANESNPKPKGQYVLVTYTATYTGDKPSADAMNDLGWSFTTDDSVYDVGSDDIDETRAGGEAFFVTPADNQSWPTRAPKGGTVKGLAVLDVPPDAIKGGRLKVETYVDNNEAIFFQEFVI